MKLQINGQSRSVDAAWRDETLLFTLREQLGLTGAKFGCGLGQCGACTVLVDGEAIRSCQVNTADMAGRNIETIEGLAKNNRLSAVQQAWLDIRVPQCGYCQAGQIMSATALLRQNPKPGRADIDDAMNGNLCRCGTQSRVRQAIRKAAGMKA